MKRTLLSLVCSAALLAGTTACNSQDSVKQAEETNEAKNETATPNSEMGDVTENSKNFDSEFMAKAASGGMLEVQLGQAVAAKATTAEAREFANKMVEDHTKANAELKALAAKKNITLPTTLGDDHQKVMKDVTEEQGVAMDKEYLKEMTKDHQEDVNEFTEASVKASDPEIKAFAAKQVPILQHHLEMAQKMSAAVEARK
ncbi:DUF4142 domain-containing protein [Hymenobacter taeanensis]|uniref:DUF4142 domain-containing protein n=1 Tax=Hymenobacter taeanensis TaxID=2735321 RepID=A0A6M6BI32_9BACT|nr:MULTISPECIES: DUF4142 domain-containing protein [Hymenobacter]QJX46953.1 DUF4142 domain-containing protein [Hymenobacter taeanensis]UOQ80832.1 DUF4142 domain-containing protein [Hymenobacter sp. 5414T-23]